MKHPARPLLACRVPDMSPYRVSRAWGQYEPSEVGCQSPFFVPLLFWRTSVGMACRISSPRGMHAASPFGGW